MTLTLEQWKEILDSVIINKDDIFEQIKRKVEGQDKGTYQRWEEKGFDVNHLFNVSPDLPSYKSTLLHIAILNGRLDMVKALLENRACDVKVKDSNGDTPLHKAAFWGHLDIVQYLIKNEADVKVKDSNGDTPLHEAAVRGYLEISQCLIENGADVNVTYRHGNTLLYKAAIRGHLKMVKALLKNKADVNVICKYGDTPLHGAAVRGYLDIVKALLENGADVNAKVRDCLNPLHSAANNGLLDIVEVLLENGADVNVTDNYGNTPLHKAIFKGHLDTAKTAFIDRLEIVKILLKNGADVNIIDKHGNTPLFLANKWSHKAIVNLIINHIAKLEVIDSYISKENLQFINASEERNNNYLQHLRNCKKEVQMIKERNESLYNFLREDDVNKMADIWKKNENVRNEFDNEESLKKLYPEYAHILINKAKGARNNNRKQESKWFTVVAPALAASGLTSGLGVAVDDFCLLAGGIIYHFSKPSNSLENSNAEVVVNQGQNYNSR